MAGPREWWGTVLHPAGSQAPGVFLRGLCWGQLCAIFELTTWMRVLSGSLGYLQMTLSWEHVSICWKRGWLCRETWNTWVNGQSQQNEG